MDPVEDLPDAEEAYHESSDEDFNPEAARAEEISSSSDEDDAADTKKQRKGKRKATDPEDLDSGDEITIEAARKKKAKKKRKGVKGGDDDDILFSDGEGGEGGLIKTRAQRRVEQKERRPLARTEGATVDVDALWAQMTAAPLKPLYEASTNTAIDASKPQDVEMGGVEAAPVVDLEAEIVTMTKVYTFAGQRTTEEKQVPRSLLDQHLSDGWKTVDEVTQEPEDAPEKPEGAAAQSKVRRPLRRPSRFDPNPLGYVRGLPLEHQLTWPRKPMTTTTADQENAPGPEAPRMQRPEKAQKLNVVDKSRLDWTGFVDKEGIGEELATHGKTKEAYLGRMEFLANVEARREEERKRAKATTS
ncbi:bucentaur or craniofacial development-domain-containing protein [Lophiotrema nucula]|uniref:SWR1-complex protein 5 n=1 Tax=Lophiotrema nucula TaxID=690887 RepID=A0A6A5ZL88_9PLEO|nr:bucentaur or craniofacial development-domain-containing protein [Lophiotrema nucula]